MRRCASAFARRKARRPWVCGFYPGSHPAEHARGSAKTFDQARGAFEIARRYFLAKCTEADFEQYRRNRAFHAWKEAMLEAGPQATDTSCGWPGHLLLRRVRVGMAYDSAARSECEAANGGGHASSACRSGCQCAPRSCGRGHLRNRSARSPVERWDHGAARRSTSRTWSSTSMLRTWSPRRNEIR